MTKKIDARMKHIRERLVEARNVAGLTQAQAAKLLDVSPSTMSFYEGGKRGIDVILLLRLCEAYSVSPVWVLTGANPDFDPAEFLERVKSTKAEVNAELGKIAGMLEMMDYGGGR